MTDACDAIKVVAYMALACIMVALVIAGIGNPWSEPNAWSKPHPAKDYDNSSSCSQYSCTPGVEWVADEWWTLPPGSGPLTVSQGRKPVGSDNFLAFYVVSGELWIDADECRDAVVDWHAEARDGQVLGGGRLIANSTAVDLGSAVAIPEPGVTEILLRFERRDALGCAAPVHWEDPQMNFSPGRSWFDWSVSEE